LQADPAAGLAIELLHGGFSAIDQGDDHLAIFGGLLAVHHDEIAVHDVLVDHGLSLHPQGIVGPAPGQHGVGNGDGLIVHEGLDRHAGRHPAEQRNLGRIGRPAWRQHLDGATPVVGTRDVALALEIGQVLMHGGQRLKVEFLRNFLEARRIPAIVDVRLEELQDLVLAFCERHRQPPLACDRTEPEQVYPKSSRRTSARNAG
jgi:hypothetical protein